METKIFQQYKSDDLIYSHVCRSGHERTGFPLHTHDIDEILFIRSGGVSCAIDGVRYRVSRNDLVMIPAFSMHDVRLEDDTPYERYDLLYDRRLLTPELEKMLSTETHVYGFDGHEAIAALFKKMDHYCARLEGGVKRLMLTDLLQELCVNVALADRDAKEYSAQTNPIVSEAIAYIDANLGTLTGVEEICGKLFITRSHLHHLFIKHLGTTPKRYVTSKRLAMAQSEISLGQRPTEVYLKCGFSDYSTFYRAFKHKFGYPPSVENDPQHTVVVHDDSGKRDPDSVA